MLFPIKMAQRTRVSNVIRLLNMTLNVTDGGGRARLSLPGFSCGDFDRKGNVTMWSLQTQMTAARIFAYHTPDPNTNQAFLEYDRLTSDKLTFIASASTRVSKSFYDMLDVGTVPKMCVDVHLGYIGESSLNTVANMLNEDTGEAYVHNVNQVVSIDPQTRKPTSLPDWWKTQYKPKVVENERLVVRPFEKPEKHYKFDLKVLWSDTDGYRHTNYVSYIRFCFDAAMSAVDAGFLPSFKNDIFDYKVKVMNMSYRSECKADDILDIACWEKADTLNTLFFDISKEGKVIFQNTVEFYA